MCRFLQWHCFCCKKALHGDGPYLYCNPFKPFCMGVSIDIIPTFFRCNERCKHHVEICNTEKLPERLLNFSARSYPDFDFNV